MLSALLTHALVTPLTQIFRQHTTATQLSIQGILTSNGPHFIKDREPAECFRTGLNQNTGSVLSVVAAAVPKPAETDDLGPHDVGSVHPFIYMPLRALCSPQIRFFVELTKDVWPNRQFVVVGRHLGPANLAEGSEYSPLCFLLVFSLAWSLLCSPEPIPNQFSRPEKSNSNHVNN